MWRFTKIAAICLVASTLCIFAYPSVMATEHWRTIYAPAKYSGGVKVTSSENARIYGDNASALLRWVGPPDPEEIYYQALYTRDFTAPDPGLWYNVYYPESNATITAVWLWALVYCPSHTVPFYVGYSLGHGTTYYYGSNTSSAYYYDPGNGWVEPGNTWGVWWNVTALEAWTPAKIMASDLWATLFLFGDYSFSFSIDYLGFVYLWDRPGGGAGFNLTPPDWSPKGANDWTNHGYVNISGPIVKGFVGAVGFGGLVVILPLGIFIARRSGDRGAALVKTICLGAGFFAMFLVGIG